MPISDDVLLVHGDCLDVMAKMTNEHVHFAILDLPFGITHSHWDKCINLKTIWQRLVRAGCAACTYVFFATQPFASAVVASNLEMFRYELIWAKNKGTGFLNANRRPLAQHENILVFSKTTCNAMTKTPMTYNPQKTEGKSYAGVWTKGSANYGSISSSQKIIPTMHGRHPTTLLNFGKDPLGIHPTQKPVALVEWLIRTYTNPGDLVLDPCSGSGTTAIAALNTGRRAICIEKDAGYHATAVKRLADARRGPQQGTLAI